MRLTVSRKLSSLSLFDLSYDLSGPTRRDTGVVEKCRFQQCVFVIGVGIHINEKHDSESTNNYSGKTQKAPEAPIRKRRVNC